MSQYNDETQMSHVCIVVWSVKWKNWAKLSNYDQDEIDLQAVTWLQSLVWSHFHTIFNNFMNNPSYKMADLLIFCLFTILQLSPRQYVPKQLYEKRNGQNKHQRHQSLKSCQLTYPISTRFLLNMFFFLKTPSSISR